VEARTLAPEVHRSGLIKEPKPFLFSTDVRTTTDNLRKNPHIALPFIIKQTHATSHTKPKNIVLKFFE
jgi:hypothetical protein